MAKLYNPFQGERQPIAQKPWENKMYSPLSADSLLQKGDEYLTQELKFVPVPLSVIGTAQEPFITYRRRRF